MWRGRKCCVNVVVKRNTLPTNHFALGQAPGFLKRFVAGGVSIALEKSKTAVRPLACGDPIRRLVAKCFCVAGKEDISKAFRARNYHFEVETLEWVVQVELKWWRIC